MMMFTNSFDFPDRKYEFHGGAAWTPEAIGDSMETSFGRALLICGQREFYVAGQRVDAGVGVWIPHSPRSKQIAQCVAERSEEHTSELQSLMSISYAVFCLKKKNTAITKI